MLIRATLRKAAHIHKMWAASPHKIAGYVSGARFEKRDGVFVADELTAEQIAALRVNPAVEVEMIGLAPALPVPDPVEPEPAAAEPPPAPSPTVASALEASLRPPPPAAPEKRGPGRPKRN